MNNPDQYDHMCARYYRAYVAGNHAAVAEFERQFVAAADGDDPRDVIDCAFSHGYSQTH